MNERLPARIDDLPASLVDIAETLGMRVALNLVQEFGGLEVKFPVRPKPDHRVIAALGAEDGYALCEFLGGMAIYVPRKVQSNIAEVTRLSAAGFDRATIARMLGLSQRHVRRLINQSDDDADQGDLFD